MQTAAMVPVGQQESLRTQESVVARAMEAPAPAPATDLQVELIQDYKSFIELETPWNRLVDESRIDHPFIRHEWVRTWWDCFKPEGSLFIVRVTEGSRMVALAPLMVDRGRMYGCPVRRLRGIANVYTERFDFIVTSRPEESCRAIWKFLASRSKDWDVLELRQLSPAAQALMTIPRMAIDDRFLVGTWGSTRSPYIPITGTWDEYGKGLSRKYVSNLRGRLKGLSRLGQVTHEVIQGGEGLSQAVDDALRLEGAAWKQKAGTAIVCDPKREAFYRRMMLSAAQQGSLRLYFLLVKNERVSMQISLLSHNKLYLLKSGYDPRFAAGAPSHVLCWRLLEEAWSLKYDEVDLLGAVERWKMNWTDDVRPHSWLFVFPNRPSSRFLHSIKFRLLPRIRSNFAWRLLLKCGALIGLKVHDE
ncbi:MAG: GNAT family N-acetyltransferase [Nitrospirae bacterium]|nr:GNAT family N-acetyltransferase [Nitrospirota bacterium]